MYLILFIRFFPSYMIPTVFVPTRATFLTDDLLING